MRDTAHAIAADMTAADSRTLRLLPFYLGNDAFCVDMHSLTSIERSDLLQVNPGGDPFGWLLGHEEIPVVHVSVELFPERRHASAGRILVFEATDYRLALLVDRVSRAFEADSSVVQALPAVARDPRGRVRGVVVRDESLHLLVEPLALGGTRPESAGEDTAIDGHPPLAFGEAPAAVKSPPEGTKSPPLDPPEGTKSPPLDPPEGTKSPPLDPPEGTKSPPLDPPEGTKSPPLDPPEGAKRQAPGRGQLVSFSTRQTAGVAMRYGLSLRQVAEIFPPTPVVPVPAAPAWLLGLVSWRQRPVAVVDLDRRLGEHGAAKPERLLVAWTGHGNDVVAFPVRKDLRVHNLPLDYQASRRELSLDHSVTRGVFEIADTPLVVPDVRKIAAASSAESPPHSWFDDEAA